MYFPSFEKENDDTPFAASVTRRASPPSGRRPKIWLRDGPGPSASPAGFGFCTGTVFAGAGAAPAPPRPPPPPPAAAGASRSERKAMYLPSVDQRGLLSLLSAVKVS